MLSTVPCQLFWLNKKICQRGRDNISLNRAIKEGELCSIALLPYVICIRPCQDMLDNRVSTHRNTLSSDDGAAAFLSYFCPSIGLLWWTHLVSRVVLITFDYKVSNNHGTSPKWLNSILSCRFKATSSAACWIKAMNYSYTSQHTHFTLLNEHMPA